jgi:hypothetical protein
MIQYNTVRAVLRIRDVYPRSLILTFINPRSRILTFIHPGSRKKHIPDLGVKKVPNPGSQIQIRNSDSQTILHL